MSYSSMGSTTIQLRQVIIGFIVPVPDLQLWLVMLTLTPYPFLSQLTTSGNGIRTKPSEILLLCTLSVSFTKEAPTRAQEPGESLAY